MNTANPNPPPPHVPSEFQGYFRQLQDLRESLSGTRADDAARMENGISLGILSQQPNAAAEVESAINRILRGSYGICEETGQPIPEARLRVVPWTRYTKEVLEPAERRRIGELLEFASIIPNRRDAPPPQVFPVNARMVEA